MKFVVAIALVAAGCAGPSISGTLPMSGEARFVASGGSRDECQAALDAEARHHVEMVYVDDDGQTSVGMIGDALLGAASGGAYFVGRQSQRPNVICQARLN